MIQRDFILREIEKLSAILTAFRQKIFGGKENLSIALESQVQNAKAILLNDANFDLDKFLDLNLEKSNEYISSFDGFNVENIELLAETIAQIGFDEKCSNPKKYLEKALQLYNLCCLKSKTYSIEREENMSVIENALQNFENQ